MYGNQISLRVPIVPYNIPADILFGCGIVCPYESRFCDAGLKVQWDQGALIVQKIFYVVF